MKTSWRVLLFYVGLAILCTWPLLFNLSSSLYTSSDHVSNDLYGSIARMIWLPKHLVWDSFPNCSLRTDLYCAPFGQSVVFPTLLGFVVLPITIPFGPITSANLLILAGFSLSAFCAYLLTFHITKKTIPSVIAGVIYGFCPYMLLRGQTTPDTIQAYWIPLYVLGLIGFDEERSWKRAVLVGVSLLGALSFSFPYYFTFFPILTIVFVACRKQPLKLGPHMVRIISSVLAVAVLFGVHLWIAVFPPADLPVSRGALPVKRDIAQQHELRMKPSDYVVPVQQSALVGELTKPYWDGQYRKERRNSINSAAYVGFVALFLAGYSLFGGTNRQSVFFVVVGILAFWTTLGPPGPSWVIFQYAPFVRRINAFKVFVQLSVSVLAGIGLARLFLSKKKTYAAILCAMIPLEYSIIPPAINRPLPDVPLAYKMLSSQTGNQAILEYPMYKAWGAEYQGYTYFQTIHQKPTFNGWVSSSYIPERLRPFWDDISVPVALADESNRAILSRLGIRYVVRHSVVATRTSIFRGLPLPDLDSFSDMEVVCKSPSEVWGKPSDYANSDVYAIKTRPGRIVLTWDYENPYPVSEKSSDYFVGKPFFSGDGFYPPALFVRDGNGWVSLLKQDNVLSIYRRFRSGEALQKPIALRTMLNNGKMTATNLSDCAVSFSVVFGAVSFVKDRVLSIGGEYFFCQRDTITEIQTQLIQLPPGMATGFEFVASGDPVVLWSDTKEWSAKTTMGLGNFRVIEQ